MQTFTPSNDLSLTGASRRVRSFLRSFILNLPNLSSQFFGILDNSLEPITTTFESNLFSQLHIAKDKEALIDQVKEHPIVLSNIAGSIQRKPTQRTASG